MFWYRLALITQMLGFGLAFLFCTVFGALFVVSIFGVANPAMQEAAAVLFLVLAMAFFAFMKWSSFIFHRRSKREERKLREHLKRVE